MRRLIGACKHFPKKKPKQLDRVNCNENLLHSRHIRDLIYNNLDDFDIVIWM